MAVSNGWFHHEKMVNDVVDEEIVKTKSDGANHHRLKAVPYDEGMPVSPTAPLLEHCKQGRVPTHDEDSNASFD